ncbi:protein serine threonine kinase [Niveomyces insectorum RCEF 264]|uniref:Autophagy-related protein 1 n=1 Tax=Niveomyces insectorum RCEF 264 TaxID=1081102 RepID=A0A167RF40_9HYPO|nr:protein serine threonine kinase [Niveomyces insectorum RCEF 264]
MQHVLATNGLPTPPASPLSFDHPRCAPQQQQPHQQFYQRTGGATATAAALPHHHLLQRYVPVAPEERIGSFLGGSLQLTGIIGTGAYGVVYEAVDVKTRVRYAVKALSKLNPDGTPLEARQIEYQTREIRLHYMASAHPNVVSMLKIIDVYPDCLYVVLEYCPEGDLFYNITECGQFVGKDELARRVFLQILDAVQYLHHAGIYHRDLKPENILVADRGETLKLADFGLATPCDRSEDYGCGSTFYMSPECLGQTDPSRPFYYCAPNDIWSLGVILVNLTCGRNPWKQASHEDSTYRAYTRNRGFLKTILPLTDELDDILARIFNPNPDQRITLSELKQRILACPRFTISQQQQQQEADMPMVAPQPLLTPPTTPAHAGLVDTAAIAAAAAAAGVSSEYAICEDEDDDEEDDLEREAEVVEDAVLEDNFAPLSPAPSTQCSLAASPASTLSDCCSSVGALVEDDDCSDIDTDGYGCQEDIPEAITPPPPTIAVHPPPSHGELLSVVYGSEDASMLGVEVPFFSQQPQPPPPPQQQQQQQQQQPVYHFQNAAIPPGCTSYGGNGIPLLGQDLAPHQPMPASFVQQQQLQQQQHLQQQPQQLPLPPPPRQQQRQKAREPATVCAGGGSKFFLWDWMVGKNAQQPIQQHLAMHYIPAIPFHQVPMFLQNCY